MSGIYIPGMEMPKSCCQCPVNMEVCKREYKYLLAHPELYDKRADDCPLVPIPEHGDLIDRDALSKSLDKLCDRVCQYSKAQRKVMCGACPLGDAFTVVEDDAPTIITAEKGGG